MRFGRHADLTTTASESLDVASRSELKNLRREYGVREEILDGHRSRTTKYRARLLIHFVDVQS